MKKFSLLLFCILTSFVSYAQNKYGTYSLNGTKYNVSENFIEAINLYNPAAANALRRGQDVKYYSESNSVFGIEAQDWAWLLTPEQYKKMWKEQSYFENPKITEGRQYITNLKDFDPRVYQTTLDLSQPRYLSYGIVEGKIRLLPTNDNKTIKQRIKLYLDWSYQINLLGEMSDIINVYKSFRNKEEADRYTNAVRDNIDTPDFWDRLETGGLTEYDVTILETYGIFLSKDIKIPTTTDTKLYESSGSGFILTSNGVIVTNYHVIKNANGIDVLVNQNGNVKTYKAKVLISDKTNDISLLKIDDDSFSKLATIPYAVNTRILDVGTGVFALGYPMSDILGEEIKLTDGLISSKTGYQGDIVTYQISAPIQPGSSGGPLFDQNGNIVGITNAGVPDAQNVGYAIKTSYLRNLIDVAPEAITLPVQNSISGLSFTEKIKRLTPYVVLIKVY